MSKDRSAYPIVADNFVAARGLTKRELVATMVMQGMLTHCYHLEPKDCAERAMVYANAMMQEFRRCENEQGS